MKQVSQILKNHHLRVTESRNAILGIFFREGVALSESEIEHSLIHGCDRATIYRTLSTFLDKGILHKVLDDSGAMKYALCSPGCHEGETHKHDHVHFKCNECGTTSCIEQVKIPQLELPKGYNISEINILLQGICPACMNNNHYHD